MEPSAAPTAEWMVVVNPMAGHQKGRQDWDTVSRLLDQHQIRHTHRFTESPRHCLALIRDGLGAGYRQFILAGGDGLLSEAVNAILSPTAVDPALVTLALIPVGTGNDWARTFNLSSDYRAAVETIRRGKTLRHDVGRVFYQAGNQEESWYFINMCGLGFDAEVNQKVAADRDTTTLGPLKYRYHIFSTLMGYEPTKMTLLIDGAEVRHEVFSLALGIGQYNGGGLKQLPSAVPDDGLFDLSVIQRISRLKAMRSVPRLYDGSFVDMPEVATYRGQSIRITSAPACRIEADGEALGQSPFRFEILPRRLNLVVP